MLIRLIWTAVFTLFLLTHALAQDALLDSLERALDNTLDKRQQARLSFEIASHLQHISSYDSAMQQFEATLGLALELKDDKLSGRIYKEIGALSEVKGDFQKAIEYYNLLLDVSEKTEDLVGVSRAYNNIGVVFARKGIYVKASEMIHKSLKIDEAVGDTASAADSYTNIGNIFSLDNRNDKALGYYNEALKRYEQIDELDGIVTVYNNMGRVHKNIGNLDSALFYLNKSLKINLERNNQRKLIFSYRGVGGVYYAKKQLDKALVYFRKAAEIRKSKAALGNGYDNESIGSVLMAQGKAKEALGYCKTGYDIGKRTGDAMLRRSCLKTLAKCFSQLGEFERAYVLQIELTGLKDSLMSTQKAKQIARLGFEHRYEKLNQEKELNQVRFNQQRAENKKQQILLMAFIGGFVLILLSALFILRLFVHKNKAHRLLTRQHHEINQKNKEILMQRDELEERNVEITKQRNHIQLQHQHITQSIQYAERIQRSLLPFDDLLEGLFNDYFILFKPRDVVSGDFYWVRAFGNRIVVAVADCTGHGVPGAFMSIMGISFLNEIASRAIACSSGELLDLLREKLKFTLQHNTVADQPKDGMDMALCIIDTEKRELEYSGAFNPLYLIRNKAMDEETNVLEGLRREDVSDHVLFDLSADKQPIAVYIKEKPFTTKKMEIKEGDRIYLFSDGYVDQLGGRGYTKFLKKNFRTLLLNSASKSMNQQKEVLASEMEQWKGSGWQVDDILVVGLEF